MKRLLLHVGYPKSASTSLQNGLFLGLHKAKQINFLGRAFESNFYGQLQGKGHYKTWFDNVVAQRSYNANSIGELSESLPNVLSEGLFMMNERHNDRIVGPDLLRDYFASTADKLSVLMVVRRQQDLIPSYYFQNYRNFGQKLFSEFLAYNQSQNWLGEAKIFNFEKVANAYASAFGKENVHILLFEDFVRNRGQFSLQLGSVLGIDPAMIEKLLGEEHLNKTPKEPGIVVVRKPRTKYSVTLTKIAKRLGINLTGTSQLRLPAATDEEKGVIRDSFRDSNVRFADDFSMDKQVLQKYGYF